MPPEQNLFRKMLGLKSLIKTACILDQAISHYVTGLPLEVGGSELVIFAHSQVHPQPVWVVKMILDRDLVFRVIDITTQMIKQYDKLALQEEKPHVGFDQPSASKIIHN